jgi:hypothetical protein
MAAFQEREKQEQKREGLRRTTLSTIAVEVSSRATAIRGTGYYEVSQFILEVRFS